LQGVELKTVRVNKTQQSNILVTGVAHNAMIAVLRYLRWDTLLNSVTTVKVSSDLYGNIAQSNHFANCFVVIADADIQ
jgi:hypothetical protein